MEQERHLAKLFRGFGLWLVVSHEKRWPGIKVIRNYNEPSASYFAPVQVGTVYNGFFTAPSRRL